jgi:uncharacterized protein with HEPN domain
LKKQRDFHLENALRIVVTRKRIIHGYDMVSDDMIWSIAINYLPKLKLDVEFLLKEI